MKNFLIIIFSLAAMASCRSSKKAISSTPNSGDTSNIATPSDVSANEILQKSRIDFNTFSAKVQVQSRTGSNKNPDGVARLQMKKDEFIWASVQSSFLGIEAFRLYVKKDSVILINKLEREVTIKPISYLQTITKLPLDLNKMQELLMGNPVLFCDVAGEVFESADGYAIPFDCNGKTGDYKFAKEGALFSMQITEQSAGRDFTGNLSGATNYSGKNFMTQRAYFFKEKETLDVNLKFEEVEFNKDLSPSFSIPDNYKRN